MDLYHRRPVVVDGKFMCVWKVVPKSDMYHCVSFGIAVLLNMKF